MHLVDVLIALVVILGMVRGYQTGMFRQVGSIVGFLLGFYFAAGLMTGAGARLAELLNVSAEIGPVIGFIAVFVVVYALTLLVVHFAEAALSHLELTTLNQVTGSLFGGLFAALMASAVLVLLSYVDVPSQRTRNDSHLYGPTAGLAPVVWSYMSSNRDTFKALTDRLDLEKLNDFVGPSHRAPKAPPPRRYQRPEG
jgi:uncharacterized membrane protein required for colicin V production